MYRNKLKALLILCLLTSFGLNSAPVCAQEASPAPNKQDEQLRLLLADCLKTKDELDYLTRKITALEKLTKQDKELLATYEQMIATYEQQVAAYKKALQASENIEKIDSRIEQTLQASLDDAKAQIAKWQARASFWKKIATIGGPLLIIISAGVGYVLGSK